MKEERNKERKNKNRETKRKKQINIKGNIVREEKRERKRKRETTQGMSHQTKKIYEDMEKQQKLFLKEKKKPSLTRGTVGRKKIFSFIRHKSLKDMRIVSFNIFIFPIIYSNMKRKLFFQHTFFFRIYCTSFL